MSKEQLAAAYLGSEVYSTRLNKWASTTFFHAKDHNLTITLDTDTELVRIVDNTGERPAFKCSMHRFSALIEDNEEAVRQRLQSQRKGKPKRAPTKKAAKPDPKPEQSAEPAPPQSAKAKDRD